MNLFIETNMAVNNLRRKKALADFGICNVLKLCKTLLEVVDESSGYRGTTKRAPTIEGIHERTEYVPQL